ncbi:hypothetical protein L916_16749, partial [Phytophthora nicotianae]
MQGQTSRRRVYPSHFNVLPFLDSNADIRQNQYLVFGDSAYPKNNVMMTTFRGRNLSPLSSAFNKRMPK